jgi:protein gp37
MGSNIEWTDDTWNPTTGCTMFSSAQYGNECLNCYAEKETKRLMLMGQEKYEKGFNTVVEHEQSLNEPYTWKKPVTVFVNSMSDLFHREVSDDFIRKVFKVMNDNPQHTFQILTKRNDRIEILPNDLVWSDNIWLGVSCGTQYATSRIPALVQSKAKHKFLSIEPFIREITEIDLKGIDWVIVGGESGNTSYKIELDENKQEKFELIDGKKSYTYLLDSNGKKIVEKEIRPMQKEWVDFIKKECTVHNVPFFFKQWGKKSNNPNLEDPTINNKHRYHAKGGCELDGEIYLSNPTLTRNNNPSINLFGNDYLVMDEIEDLVTIWELKSHLPFAEKALFKSLKKDIAKKGLINPIIYVTLNDKKLVIEGHTRLAALIALKRSNIPTKELNETFNSIDEIKLWMVKHQLARRNLTTIERVRLAYISKPTIENLAKENLKAKSIASSINGIKVPTRAKLQPIDTCHEIAKIANVGKTTVVSYFKIMSEGSEELKKKVDKGQLSISAGHKSLDKKKSIATPKPQNITIPETNKSDDSSTVEIFESIEIGQQKIQRDEIDVLMIFNKTDKLDILSKYPKVRIGVFYLS